MYYHKNPNVVAALYESTLGKFPGVPQVGGIHFPGRLRVPVHGVLGSFSDFFRGSSRLSLFFLFLTKRVVCESP